MERLVVPKLNTASAVLDLLSDQKEYQKRLGTLKEMEAKLDNKLERFNKITDISKFEAKTTAELTRAENEHRKATNDAAVIRVEAEAYLADVRKKAKKMMDDLKLREVSLEAGIMGLAKDKVEIRKREEETERVSVESQLRLEKADGMGRAAGLLQEEFNDKIKRIGAIAAE